MRTTYNYSDVLVVPRNNYNSYGSRKEAMEWIRRDPRIIVANMDNIGTVSMARALSSDSGWVALTKRETYEHVKNPTKLLDNVILTLGEDADIYDSPTFKVHYQECFHIMRNKPERQNFMMFDVANAYRKRFIDLIHLVSNSYFRRSTNAKIIAGNVCTFGGAWNLLRAGADIVKVGVGPGSLCLTREVTGVGMPQVTAIQDARRAVDLWNMLHPFSPKRMIIADGGITCSGDVTKALVAGADYVMVGGMFAGSLCADQQEVSGSSVVNASSDYKVSEGRSLIVQKTAESPAEIYNRLNAGIASAATYLGARSYEDFRKKGRLVSTTKILNTSLVEKGR